ncbi:hypothetical protein ACU635_27970 [[Actinomadura] parvosata]|uniref:hypothetical protein n=1 Tax=[Actinomadura] parvosata TaxID=1955412 RepID=UPI00406C5C98
MPADMRCASIEVPADRSGPQGKKITLHVARPPATDPARRIGGVVGISVGYGMQEPACSAAEVEAEVEAEVDDLVALVGHAGGNAYVFGHPSGAILALEASLRGAGIAALALFEPPPAGGDEDAELLERLRELVRAGRRGEAVEAFQAAIGLPQEMIAGMRRSPFRAVLEGIAPTLAYDTAVANGADPARYASVTAPVLVLGSEASPDLLRSACGAHGRGGAGSGATEPAGRVPRRRGGGDGARAERVLRQGGMTSARGARPSPVVY